MFLRKGKKLGSFLDFLLTFLAREEGKNCLWSMNFLFRIVCEDSDMLFFPSAVASEAVVTLVDTVCTPTAVKVS